jgi:hypothetical protein
MEENRNAILKHFVFQTSHKRFTSSNILGTGLMYLVSVSVTC